MTKAKKYVCGECKECCCLLETHYTPIHCPHDRANSAYWAREYTLDEKIEMQRVLLKEAQELAQGYNDALYALELEKADQQ